MYTKVQQNLAFDNTSTLESHYVVGKNNVRGCFLNILWGTYVEVLYTVTSRVNWTEAALSCSKPGYTIADTYSFNKFLEEERLILFWVGIFRREFIKIDTGRYTCMCRFWQYRPYIFSAFLWLCQYFSFILKKLSGSSHRYSGHCPVPSVLIQQFLVILYLFIHIQFFYRIRNIYRIPVQLFIVYSYPHNKKPIYSPSILYTDSYSGSLHFTYFPSYPLQINWYLQRSLTNPLIFTAIPYNPHVSTLCTAASVLLDGTLQLSYENCTQKLPSWCEVSKNPITTRPHKPGKTYDSILLRPNIIEGNETIIQVLVLVRTIRLI